MRRSAGLATLTMLAAVLAVSTCSSSFADSRGGNCQEQLVGKSYECAYLFFAGDSGDFGKSNCMEFVTGGISQNFKLVGKIGSLASDFRCACSKTGSYSSPSSPVAADSFDCVGSTSANMVQFHGKIASNKLYGQASEEGGISIIFNCTKRSTPCLP